MKRLKYLNNKEIESSGKTRTTLIVGFKTSLIFIIILYYLLLTPIFLFAGGMIYWTPNGVVMNNFNAGVMSPIDDMKGGAITLTISSPSPTVYFIYAIRVDHNGNLPWGLNGRKVDSSNVYQVSPLGVSDEKGGAIVVWPRGANPWSWLCYQRIDSIGNKAWGDTACRVVLSDSQINPVVVSDNAGGVIVAWQQWQHGQYDIYAQRIDSSGILRWGDNGVAVCMADSSQEYPAMTCDNSGNSVIAWADYRNGQYDIYGQRLNSNGISFWPLNGIAFCDTNGPQTFSWGYSPYGSYIVMATDTTIIVTWIDQRTGNCDIYAQSYSLGGLPNWLSQGIPICDTINRQRGVGLSLDGKGGVFFCWIDERNGYKNIYVQRINRNGQKLWANQGIPITTSDSTYFYQRIVNDGRSGAIICWQDRRTGNYDIYAQHIDSLGNIVWDTNGMPVCTAVNNQQYQEMIASDSGRAIICWTDYRSGSSRGYAQKVGDEIIGIIDKMQGTRCEMQDMTLEICPNPSSNHVTIKFQIPSLVESRIGFQKLINIYNCAGQLVKVFDLSNYRPSINQITWDGKDNESATLPNGFYFCELNVGSQRFIKKIILLH